MNWPDWPPPPDAPEREQAVYRHRQALRLFAAIAGRHGAALAVTAFFALAAGIAAFIAPASVCAGVAIAGLVVAIGMQAVTELELGLLRDTLIELRPPRPDAASGAREGR